MTSEFAGRSSDVYPDGPSGACTGADAAYRAFLEELDRQPEALPTAEQQLDQKLEAGVGRCCCLNYCNERHYVRPLDADGQFGAAETCMMILNTCSSAAPAGDADGDGRVVTPLMAFFQEKEAPKERDRRTLPVRGKPGARGRGLVGSALASISEAAADAGATRTQVRLQRTPCLLTRCGCTPQTCRLSAPSR